MRTPTCLGQQNPHCTARYHGTRSAYSTHGCRCDHAYEALRIYNKRCRQGRHIPTITDATGTARRLRALVRGDGHTGWPLAELGARLNCTEQSVRQWANQKYRNVHLDTHARVAALYRQLADTPGPSTDAAERAGRWGWPGPDAWTDHTIDNPDAQPVLGDGVDEVLIHRAIHGDQNAARALSPAERVEAARLLVRRGLGAGGVSSRLRVSSRMAYKLVDQAKAAA
jgi:hypothetical protein